MPEHSRSISPNYKYLLIGASCVVLSALAVPCRASESLSYDWNGIWKLVPAKSRVYGPTLRISRSSDGVYHNTVRIGTANFDCDGKGHLVGEDLTVFCWQKDSNHLEISTFKNGSKESTARWELSNHGNGLTIQGTLMQAIGPPKTIEAHFTRTAGSDGFVGGWRNADLFSGLASMLKTNIGGSMLHFYYPEKNLHIDLATDGTSSAINTSVFPSGATVALSEHNPRQVDLTTKPDGKAVYIENWRMSADGRSLIQSSWFTERPVEKYVLVYQKQ